MASDATSPGSTRRTVTMLIATGLTIALIWLASQFKVPYAAEGPGPTLDTLGEQDGKALITVADATTYPTSGKLLATTVSIWGGPGNGLSLLRLLSLWLDGDTILPEHYLFQVDETEEENDKTSSAQQTNSQEDATVAALGEVGKPVPTTLTVAEPMPGGPAVGKVEAGDVLTSIDGAKLVTYADLVAAMAKIRPGETATVGLTRDGAARTAEIVTAAGDDGGAILGLALDPTFDIPIDVTFNIENVGGPSAGTMYALGIVDMLTPEDLTGGETIAGTGTIDAAGRVGAIGGAEQKARGAARDGATYFLLPTSNCADLGDPNPDGMRAVPIDTLHEARQYVEDIAAGDTAALPACPAN